MAEIARIRICIAENGGAGVHISRRLPNGRYSLYKVGSVHLPGDDDSKRTKFLQLLPQLYDELPPQTEMIHIAATHPFLRNKEFKQKAKDVSDLPMRLYGIRRMKAQARWELKTLAEDAERGYPVWAIINDWQSAGDDGEQQAT
ncbi:hypothetical protein HUG15_00350 [Salicibibacter cibarius]|uniref:Uncharacterized protein n=1 Tax=Salicibibacter cibarius TaxID=2743000 RepID=A0A7T7C9U8_9BACI|nr:hypothetical protein [Salicibibacter cibarius]QQK74219.1 hypothetical protein HUG15_00350 [Salicibibacter cibarius]